MSSEPLESLMEKDQSPSASSPTGDPWLLTPGPLTTSPTVKQAMLHDYGSRDRYFVQVNDHIRKRLVDLVGGGQIMCAYHCKAAAPLWSRRC